MSLQTALSGLTVAQTGIDTTSNDLANANTTAFKSQTALFEDVFPANSSNVPGNGAALEGISSNLTEGNLTATGNSLDAAIQGNGYFVVSNNGTQQYTRDGAFQMSSTGQIQTLNNSSVLGYQMNNGVQSAVLSPITVNTGSVPATASSNIGLTLTLNSADTAPTVTPFNPATPASYNESTSVVTYDSLGNANRTQLYFVQQPATGGATPNWTVYAQPQLANGSNAGTYQALTPSLVFSSSGTLTSGSTANLTANWGNGAAPSNIAFNFAGTTLGAQSFGVVGTTNNGNPPGTYTGTSISSDGSVVSTYSNGQTLSAGKIAIGSFINPEGLSNVSGNLYTSNSQSGVASLSSPGTGLAGTLKGGEIESSNVSTSSLLVSLIQYQQAYQANTSVIQTEQQDSQRLIQI